MKTLYSSTFLSAILAFLLLLGQSGQPVTVVQGGSLAPFKTIIEPIGPEAPSSGEVRVEIFNTFGCDSCDRFGLNTLPQLVEKYAEDPAVNVRLYLIPDLDSEAELYAVRGAHCAARYERYWDMVSELHKSEVLSRREVDLIGQSLELPIVPFRNCIDSEDFNEQIQVHLDYATGKKIQQKPSILVNGVLLLGAQPLENIDLYIQRELNK